MNANCFPKIFRFFILAVLRFYRSCLSPLLGPRCRFYPSCSEYAMHCFAEEKLLKACYRVLKRLISCHPFHPGGVDLP